MQTDVNLRLNQKGPRKAPARHQLRVIRRHGQPKGNVKNNFCAINPIGLKSEGWTDIIISYAYVKVRRYCILYFALKSISKLKKMIFGGGGRGS